MSRCNYCLVQNIRRVAANAGEQVTVLPVTRKYREGNLSIITGYTVYLHPADVTIDETQVHELIEEPPPYFAAWLAALPDHCVCGED